MNENNKTRCRFGFDGNVKDVKPEAKKVVAGIEIFYPIQHKELLTHLIEKILLETYDHEADQFNMILEINEQNVFLNDMQLGEPWTTDDRKTWELRIDGDLIREMSLYELTEYIPIDSELYQFRLQIEHPFVKDMRSNLQEKYNLKEGK